jgi:calcium-independent phospholipase A2-gamma
VNHVTLRDLLPGSVYYRFNPFLSDYFPLDEVREEKIATMRDDTRMYLRRNSNRVVEACDRLLLPRRTRHSAADAVGQAAEVAKSKLLLLRR